MSMYMNQIEILHSYPRLQLANLPTPLHKLENISKELGINLYCKRDDLTGFAFGGNKVRKIEYLIAEAVNQKATAIVTDGAYQSNFCRIAAAAGAYIGLDVHLVLGGNKEPSLTGNYLLVNYLGANIHHVKSDEWNDWKDERKRLSEKLRKEGKVVYEMPIGGSVPLGTLGYVAAFFELMDYFKRLEIEPKHIFFASLSGGTQAGLLVGQWLSGWNGNIIGIGAAKSGGQLGNEVAALASRTADLFNIKPSLNDILVDGSYVGEGYGVPTKECEQAIEYFARKDGIFLDRVYSCKAAAGMLDYVKSEKINREEAVVFLHTGGNVELFA